MLAGPFATSRLFSGTIRIFAVSAGPAGPAVTLFLILNLVRGAYIHTKFSSTVYLTGTELAHQARAAVVRGIS